MGARPLTAGALFLAFLAAGCTVLLIALASIAAIAGSVSDRVGMAILATGAGMFAFAGAAVFIGVRAMKKAGGVPRELQTGGRTTLILGGVAAAVVIASTQVGGWVLPALADVCVVAFAIRLLAMGMSVLRLTPPPTRRAGRW